VRGYFGRAIDGLPIVYVEQAERLGTGHALALAAAALRPSAPVIGWQADLFPTAAMVDAVARHPAPNVVTLGPGHEDESDRLRATVEGDRVTRVWDGDGRLYDVGLWKLAPAVLGRMTEVRAEKGEYRMLPNLQRSLDEGAEVGHVVADAWIHLGGTLPTPEANVRDVVRRVWAASDALAAGGAAAATNPGGFGEAEPQAFPEGEGT
jgi:bifunctional UDP-N-acetylglucosamine pyrophosphorylase/glucosamine-1-phosphate N-acetyltransferase